MLLDIYSSCLLSPQRHRCSRALCNFPHRRYHSSASAIKLLSQLNSTRAGRTHTRKTLSRTYRRPDRGHLLQLNAYAKGEHFILPEVLRMCVSNWKCSGSICPQTDSKKKSPECHSSNKDVTGGHTRARDVRRQQRVHFGRAYLLVFALH